MAPRPLLHALVQRPILAGFAYAFACMIPMFALQLLAEPGSWAMRALGAAFGLLICSAVVRLNPHRSARENAWCVAGAALAGAILPPMALGWSAAEAYRSAMAHQRRPASGAPPQG